MTDPKKLPFGGEALWNMRIAGQVPDDLVCVSLVGAQAIANPQLWVGDGVSERGIGALEWRMLAGLDVELLVRGDTPLPRVIALVRAVAPHADGIFLSYIDAGITFTLRFGAGRLLPYFPVQYDEPSGERSALAGAIHRALRDRLSTGG